MSNFEKKTEFFLKKVSKKNITIKMKKKYLQDTIPEVFYSLSRLLRFLVLLNHQSDSLNVKFFEIKKVFEKNRKVKMKVKRKSV